MDVYASEQEQIEAIKKWCKENGAAVILGIVIGVGGLFGWRAWQARVTVVGEQASTGFQEMLADIEGGKAAEAETVGRRLLSDFGDTAYGTFAALMLARLAVDNGDLEAARAHLQWVVDNAGPAELKLVAKLRLARLYLDGNELEAASKLLDGMEDADQLVAYQELKGDILVARKDYDAAREAYRQALALAQGGGADVELLQLKLDDLGHGRTEMAPQT